MSSMANTTKMVVGRVAGCLISLRASGRADLDSPFEVAEFNIWMRAVNRARSVGRVAVDAGIFNNFSDVDRSDGFRAVFK